MVYDPDSLETLTEDVRRHGRGLRALARSLVGAELADDVVQEVWLARARAGGRRPEAPGSWSARRLDHRH